MNSPAQYNIHPDDGIGYQVKYAHMRLWVVRRNQTYSESPQALESDVLDARSDTVNLRKMEFYAFRLDCYSCGTVRLVCPPKPAVGFYIILLSAVAL